MLKREFIEQSHIDSDLINAVIKQLGNWGDFKESAPDITSYGIDGGFGGFIYYSDTIAFFCKNNTDIIQLVKNMASDLGVSSIEMIQGFNCLGSDYELDEIAQTLYTIDPDEYQTQVANALAWFAAEEVCRSYIDLID